jgi:hypothetical protein
LTTLLLKLSNKMCIGKTTFFFVFLSLYFVSNLSSQTIEFVVKDSANKLIDVCYARFYCNAGFTGIVDYKIIVNGSLLYKKNESCSPLFLQLSASGYRDFQLIITEDKFKAGKIVCVLAHVDMNILAPVVVAARQNPIQIKNDTTTFTLSRFKDGTEGKLEDILKKLPGIVVNDKTGQINFKGKPIETILIEGDNLLGDNYTIGSKNIDANQVVEVQAIENYSDNYVLMGLEGNENVALNIKINTSGLKVSASGEVGLGIFQNKKPAGDINANAIGIGKIHKFFSVGSYNNIGLNKSSNDYLANNPSLSQIRDKSYYAPVLVDDPSFTFLPEPERFNRNNQFFVSYNGLVKFSHRLTAKLNQSYERNNINNFQIYENAYFINNDTVSYTDQIETIKNPNSYSAVTEIRYAINSKRLLQFSSAYTFEGPDTDVNALYSGSLPLKGLLKMRNGFSKNALNYTQRINKQNALMVEVKDYYNNLKQNFNVSPSVYKLNSNAADMQSALNKKHSWQGIATIYGVSKKTKYNAFLSVAASRSNFNSVLETDSASNIISSLFNDFLYTKKNISQGATMDSRLGSWKILLSYSLSYLSQTYSSKVSNKSIAGKRLYFEPKVYIRYQLSKASALNLGYTFRQPNEVENHLFENPILRNFRNTVSNTVSLDLFRVQSLQLSYSLNDLFNQFENSTGIRLNSKPKDFFPFYSFSDTLTHTIYTIGRTNERGIDIYLQSGKFFPTIGSLHKIAINYSAGKFRNFIESAGYRDNSNKIIDLSYYAKSSFAGKINFEMEHNYSFQKSGAISQKAIANASMNGYGKIIFRLRKSINTHVASNYFFPDLNNKSGYFFLDYQFSLKPPESKVLFKLVAKNMLNQKAFQSFSVSDYSRSRFSTNIFPASVLAYFSFTL